MSNVFKSINQPKKHKYISHKPRHCCIAVSILQPEIPKYAKPIGGTPGGLADRDYISYTVSAPSGRGTAVFSADGNVVCLMCVTFVQYAINSIAKEHFKTLTLLISFCHLV